MKSFHFLLQNVEKDRKIASLQRQLDSQTIITTSEISENFVKSTQHGATQTERVINLTISIVLQS